MIINSSDGGEEQQWQWQSCGGVDDGDNNSGLLWWQWQWQDKQHVNKIIGSDCNNKDGDNDTSDNVKVTQWQGWRQWY